MCPDNILTAAIGEETNISWPEPIFTDSLGFELNITSIFDANTTSLGWGEQRVEYTAINTYNNLETTCVFYIDVMRKYYLYTNAQAKRRHCHNCFSTHTCSFDIVSRQMGVQWLGPRRYTNVFDESKINRIRWIAMFWTEYNDTLKKKKKKKKLWFVLFGSEHLQWCKFIRMISFYYSLKTFNDCCDIIISF